MNTPKGVPCTQDPSVRPPSLSSSRPSCSRPCAAAAAPISGVVLDSSGRAIPRALVTVVDAAGSAVGTTFTYPDGTFSVEAATPSGCRVQASLSGFETASVPCGAGTDLRLSLTVAPLQEAVVVSATRTEAPLGQLASSVTVFTAEDIEARQRPPVIDLLRTAPGAIVVDNGSRGSVSSLFVRGGESDYTKVLLDGIPLNEPGGTFDFGNITTENLDRVELVRGAQSALFGSDAMSGVVQLFTARAPAGAAKVATMVEGGTFGTGRVSASAAGRAGELDYSVGAAYYSTNNDVPNNDFDNTTLSGSVGVPLGPRASLRFTGRAELGTVGTPGQSAFGRPDLDASFERNNGVGGVTFTQTLTPSFSQRATYALSVTHQTSTNLIADPPYTPSFDGRTAPFEFSDFLYDTKNELRRHYASYQADWRLAGSGRSGTHLLTFAGDLDGERADSHRQDGRRHDDAEQEQHRRDATGSDPVVACVRGRRACARAQRQLRRCGRASRLGGVHRTPIGGHRRGHPPEGFRRRRHQGADPCRVLQPFVIRAGKSRISNRSARRASTSGIEQRLLDDRARVELTWFAARYENIISAQPSVTNPFAYEYINIGLTRASGAELSGEIALVQGLLFRGGYTLLDSRILEGPGESEALLRRPRNSGYMGIAWSAPRLTAQLTGVFIGRRVDNDFSSLEPPIDSNAGYGTLNVSAAYKILGPLAITAAIDNLANVSYMEPLGYPALGRAIRFGARVGF